MMRCNSCDEEINPDGKYGVSNNRWYCTQCFYEGWDEVSPDKEDKK